MSATHIIINAKSGTAMRFQPDDLKALLSAEFDGDTQIDIVEPHALVSTLHAAFSAPQTNRVIIGGGDGSVSLAGRIALETDKALGVIPLGTMNLFARTLRIPLELEAAARALANGYEGRVDVGDADGTVFLNHISIGLHPRMIRLRDRMPRSGRLTKIANGFRAMARVLMRPEFHRLDVTGDFEPLSLHTALALVTVNPIDEDAGPLPIRVGQSYGKLGCTFARRRDVPGLVAMAARLSAGGWKNPDHLIRRETDRVTLKMRRKVRVSIDGELEMRRTPITCIIRKQALRVVLPAAE